MKQIDIYKVNGNDSFLLNFNQMDKRFDWSEFNMFELCERIYLPIDEWQYGFPSTVFKLISKELPLLKKEMLEDIKQNKKLSSRSILILVTLLSNAVAQLEELDVNQGYSIVGSHLL